MNRPLAASAAGSGMTGYELSTKLHKIPGTQQVVVVAVKCGDRVKLTDRAARGAMRQSLGRGHKVDWFARRGVAVHVSAAAATVQWDDRQSVDHWPANALERA